MRVCCNFGVQTAEFLLLKGFFSPSPPHDISAAHDYKVSCCGDSEVQQ